MPLKKDIWRSGIAHALASDIISSGSFAGAAVSWLPDPGSFRFFADPFGLWRSDQLYVFVEAYDYRVRIGSIEVLIYGPDFVLRDHRTVLREPWHLSYPIIWEAEGQTWMLPEAHRSKGATLYRATDFPFRWKAEHRLALPDIPVDATPVRYQGRWWLFYSPASSEFDKMGTLHAASSLNLQGPWVPHPCNPLRQGLDGSRPAGRARVDGDAILLPVQDCSRTYGGAVRVMAIRISPASVDLTLGAPIGAPTGIASFDQGLHTLSAAGPITLFDVKRVELSSRSVIMDGAYELSKLRRRLEKLRTA